MAILPEEPVLTAESLILATSRSRLCWVVRWLQCLPAVAYEKEKVWMLQILFAEIDKIYLSQRPDQTNPDQSLVGPGFFKMAMD